MEGLVLRVGVRMCRTLVVGVDAYSGSYRYVGSPWMAIGERPSRVFLVVLFAYVICPIG